jgi:GntR family transcriptional repressor for pyruvate dehydrogenase complex
VTDSEKQASRVEEIAAELRAQIVKGKYGPGERLPSERELSERLGVNRASAREALKKLEQLGIISIRRGGGARVLPMEQAGLGALQHMLSADVPPRELVEQWLDVHELVIAGATRLAVQRATSEEVTEAKRLARRLCDSSLSDDDYIRTNDDMTALIARASRNVVLRMVRDGLTATAQKRHDARKNIRPPRKLMLGFVREAEHALDARDAAAVEAIVHRLFALTRNAVLDAICGPAPRH